MKSAVHDQLGAGDISAQGIRQQHNRSMAAVREPAESSQGDLAPEPLFDFRRCAGREFRSIVSGDQQIDTDLKGGQFYREALTEAFQSSIGYSVDILAWSRRVDRCAVNDENADLPTG